MLNRKFKDVLDNFVEDKRKYSLAPSKSDEKKFSNFLSANLVLDEIPELFNQNIDKSIYHIYGSVGKGNMASVPWIGIFDKDITKTASSGYYIVYLFNAKMKGFYLSLGLGWTQFEDKYKNKEEKASDEILRYVKLCQDKLRSKQGFSLNKINLDSNSTLPRGYENGTILSKYYQADEIPDNPIILSDFSYMIGLYRELKGIVGNDIFKIEASNELAHVELNSGDKQKEQNKNTAESENESKERKNAAIFGRKAELLFKDFYIENYNWEIEDKTKYQNVGYDFKCKDSDGDTWFVEIKGCRKEIDNLRITNKEWEIAEKDKDQFLLIIVKDIDEKELSDITEDNFVEIYNPHEEFNDVIETKVTELKYLSLSKKHIVKKY